MANDSLITKEQYNADMKRFYNEYIYQYLNGATHTGCVPLGTILPYFGETAPTHFLICDGTAYNKVDYPELAAHLLALTDPSPYVVSGDDTKFKVPDLRGEFLRGSGTNSHTNQGNGANVGVHQDATSIPDFSIYANNNNPRLKFTYNVNDVKNTNYPDAVSSSGNTFGELYKSTTYASSGNSFITTRPTNTSVTYIIAYRNAYIDLALDGFPIDITNPTDGQLLMWNATAGRWVNGGHKYSTDEHVVGTWIDGKPVYEKIIYVTNSCANGANIYVEFGVTADILIDYECMFYDPVHKYFFKADRAHLTQVNSNVRVIGYATSLQLSIGTQANVTEYTKQIITIQYTKTTD